MKLAFPEGRSQLRCRGALRPVSGELRPDWYCHGLGLRGPSPFLRQKFRHATSPPAAGPNSREAVSASVETEVLSC